jgi:hypothetical protein
MCIIIQSELKTALNDLVKIKHKQLIINNMSPD